MAHVAAFEFNPFQENTYIVYDETKECIIFDPGCYQAAERQQLDEFIASAGLKPVRLINTHCHVDHVLGNKHVAEKYGLKLEMHKGEIPVLQSVPMVCQMYGIPGYDPSPEGEVWLEEGDVVTFGETKLEVLFTPGHSPASLSFFCRADGFLIAGDVLFQNSIGRTDLPGGDFDTLIRSIKEKLFPLGDEVKVYPGHGPATTIGYEKGHNGFLV